MTTKKILSYLGGYFKNTTFDLDISKIADIAETDEDNITNDLNKLMADGFISLDNNTVSLLNIKSATNKQFNDLYAPIETMTWAKGAKLVLDKI